MQTTTVGTIKRIPCIDGLRAISICLVLLGHSMNTLPFGVQWFLAVRPILTNATLGVTCFFVISGYLITILLRAEWQRTNTIDLGAFYRRRILRIFPAFYSYVLVVAALTLMGILTIAPSQIVYAATFLWNYHHIWSALNDDANWFLGHFWTLSLEEQFYLLWPLALLVFGPTRASRFALVLIVTSPVIRVFTYFFWSSARGQIGIMLHTASDSLMFGCLAALWEGNSRFEDALNSVKKHGVMLLVAICTFLIFVSPLLREAFRGAYEITIGITLESLSVVVLLSWLIRNPNSRLGELLQHPVIVHVGVISYSLYLWQQLFLTPLNRTWSGYFPINLFACFIVAECSYFLIERNFLRLRQKRVDDSAVQTPAKT